MVVVDQLHEAGLCTDVVLIKCLYDVTDEQFNPLCNLEFIPGVIHHQKFKYGVARLLRHRHRHRLVHVLYLPPPIFVGPLQDVCQCFCYPHLHEQPLFLNNRNTFGAFWINEFSAYFQLKQYAEKLFEQLLHPYHSMVQNF